MLKEIWYYRPCGLIINSMHATLESRWQIQLGNAICLCLSVHLLN